MCADVHLQSVVLAEGLIAVRTLVRPLTWGREGGEEHSMSMSVCVCVCVQYIHVITCFDVGTRSQRHTQLTAMTVNICYETSDPESPGGTLTRPVDVFSRPAPWGPWTKLRSP